MASRTPKFGTTSVNQSISENICREARRHTGNFIKVIIVMNRILNNRIVLVSAACANKRTGIEYPGKIITEHVWKVLIVCRGGGVGVIRARMWSLSSGFVCCCYKPTIFSRCIVDEDYPHALQTTANQSIQQRLVARGASGARYEPSATMDKCLSTPAADYRRR